MKKMRGTRIMMMRIILDVVVQVEENEREVTMKKQLTTTMKEITIVVSKVDMVANNNKAGAGKGWDLVAGVINHRTVI
jgi:hypothetical protein